MAKQLKWKLYTELTNSQWQVIRGFFHKSSQRGAPRKHDRRQVVNGILYLVRTRCYWQLLPNRYPQRIPFINCFIAGGSTVCGNGFMMRSGRTFAGKRATNPRPRREFWTAKA